MDFEEDKIRIVAVAGIVLIIAVAFGLLFLSSGEQEGEAIVKVVNEEGNGVWKAGVEIEGNDFSESGLTNKEGKVSFEDVPFGMELIVKVEADGFKDKSERVVFGGEEQRVVIEAEEENSVELESITFTNSAGVRLAGKLITVEMSCSTGMRLEEPVRQVSNGFLEFRKPSGCGTLIVTASASGLERESFNLDETGIIKMSEYTPERGRVKIVAENEDGELLDGIEASVFDSLGSPVGFSLFTDFGEAIFELNAGSYELQLYDPDGSYISKRENFTVSAGDDKEKRIVLERNPADALRVRVVDGQGIGIDGADVIITHESGEKINFSGSSVALSLEGDYNAIAVKDGYVLRETVEFNSQDREITIILDQCTPSICGLLRVKVVDEDGFGVLDARVGLLQENGFYAEKFGVKFTDSEGEVSFRGVENGNYRVFVQKAYAETESELFSFTQGEDKDVEVELEIGDGVIEVKVTNRNKEPVFGTAEFFDSSGERLGSKPIGVDGFVELETKADKSVYVRIESEDYLPFTSRIVKVLKDVRVRVDAVLFEESEGEIGVELKGIEERNGRNFARFVVSAGADFEEVGLFVRVGGNGGIDDEFFIESLEVGGASYIKGKEFNPPKNEREDSGKITNGRAKWANVSWDEPAEGAYEAVVEIEGKGDVHYRAYGYRNGEYFRSPFDAELGQGESSGAKDSLYAESFVEKIGSEQECFEGFCFEYSVLDLDDDLFIEEPLNLKIFGSYKLEFRIRNDTGGLIDDGEIRVINGAGAFPDEKISINSYEIINADASPFSSPRETFEIESIGAGYFDDGREIRGSLFIEGTETGESPLVFRIFSDRTKAFEKALSFNVVDDSELQIEAEPEIFPSLTGFEAIIVASSGEEKIMGAEVEVEKIYRGDKEIIFSGITDAEGEVRVSFPPMMPGTRVRIVAQKPGVTSDVVEKEVTSGIISIEPEEIGSELSLTSKNNENIRVTVRNLVPVNLETSDIRISGNFSGLLDSDKMNNWLGQYEGIPFNSGGEFVFDALFSLGERAFMLEEIRELTGELVVEVEKDGTQWVRGVPIEIRINLAEPPKEENCIDISLKEWKDSSLGGKAEKEFSIVNNCVTRDNVSLNLRNLKAKVDWKSNRFGTVELHVLDPLTGMEATEVLKEGVYGTFFESFEAGKEYIGLLVFTPNAGTSGEKAVFSVEIAGAQITNAGEQLVGGSNVINSEISVIDLANCIDYEPDAEIGLIIEGNRNEGVINIDSTQCGAIDIDFWMCMEDEDCSAGLEGGIAVKPNKFTLSPQNPKKSVLVQRREIPGMYGIEVFVKTPSSPYRKIGLIDVLLKPKPEDPFELSKYEFSIIGSGAKDSAELTNKYLAEEIIVNASLCDWGEASEKGWWNWKHAGVGAITGALQGLSAAGGAANSAAKESTSQAAAKLLSSKISAQEAKEQFEKVKQQTNELCTAIQTDITQGTETGTQCTRCTPVTTSLTLGALNALNLAAGTCTEMQANQQTRETYYKELEQSLEKGNANNFTESTYDDSTRIIGQIVSSIEADEASLKAIDAKLTTAATAYTDTEKEAAIRVMSNCTVGTITEQCTACVECQRTAQQSINETTLVINEASELERELAKETQEAAKLEAEIEATKTQTDTAQKKADKADKASKEGLLEKSSDGITSPIGIFSINVLAGFFLGGIQDGLFGADPCDQRRDGVLPDYVINLLDDAGLIESEQREISVYYPDEFAKIIGMYNDQKRAIVVENTGVESSEPVYSTVTFNATQHIHDDPTKISRGNSDFGPFNVPDRQALLINPKIHLKFKTTEQTETLPDLSFDTLSCVSGNRIGRSGEGALPKVKFAWNFGDNGIGINECLEENENGIYCDATQFSIMLSRRLNALDEFFSLNSELPCPENIALSDLEEIASEYGIEMEQEGCFLPRSGFVGDKAAVVYFVEANRDRIRWTAEIGSVEEFEEMIRFRALLMRDGYSDDFKRDFSYHYSEERFFDTPDWFFQQKVDNAGNAFGINRFFEDNNMRFRNRHFDSHTLPASGVYDVFIDLEFGDENFRVFDEEGRLTAPADISFLFISEPEQGSAFYTLPLNGLVGFKSNEFERQGYGVGFSGNGEIHFNDDEQPLKDFYSGSSNPLSEVESELRSDFYSLNTSPSTRGDLLSLEKKSSDEIDFVFSPSAAEPVMIKAGSNNRGEEVSVYYRVKNGNEAMEVGSVMNYWNGAGACLDFSGLPVTEKFNETPDRAVVPSDSLIDWQRAYAVDFGTVNYTGDVYVRTIFYTNPEEVNSISLEDSSGAELIGRNSNGSELVLGGVSNIDSVNDIFNLVKSNDVCIVDSGRKASFFWNPKSVYEKEGVNKSISEISNTLEAGESCIGFG